MAKEKIKFRSIPQYTQWGSYAVHHPWSMLPETIKRYVEVYNLDIDPDFQRGYVWTTEQKIKFVEYGLKGGKSGMNILLNCPDWNRGGVDGLVLVDGKQRINAVLSFINNEFPVFGDHYFRDFSDQMDIVRSRFYFHINDLRTREEVLQWYLDLNSGGTVHTEEDLDKVRKLIEKEKGK
jgi:hypothetical protein